MGDRALIQLTDGKRYSPSLYVHRDGSRARSIIKDTQKRMEGRTDDLEYSFARLVQIAIGDDEGNMGFGVQNEQGKLTAEDSPGNHGVFIANINNNWRVEHID